MYDQDGGTVDFRLKTLNGSLRDGSTVSCSLSDVESVRLKARFDTAKTTLLTGGITIFAILFSFSQMDFAPAGGGDW